MSLKDIFKKAGIHRVLMVDDDLSTAVSLASLDEHGGSHRLSAVLADPEHEDTVELDRILAELGKPATTAEARASALGDPAVLQAAPEDFRLAYQGAQAQREGFREPLNKIKGWLPPASQLTVTDWEAPAPILASDRYDLLLIDYYLVDNDSAATLKLISDMVDAHRDQANPLLIVLMSSYKQNITAEFEVIRARCAISASRFRILEKPSVTNLVDEPVIKERWLRALAQLAAERPLVNALEAFVRAWKGSLDTAVGHMTRRLYDLDASAFALLMATAAGDSMRMEEYLADILSRRISAEAEENSFPFEEIGVLEAALEKAKGEVGPTIDQGVEVRDAQRAIRYLMSDVGWHRRAWWEPRVGIPVPLVSVPAVAEAHTSMQVDGSSDAAVPRHESAVASAVPQAVSSRTDERLKWLKRYVRFGTVLRERTGLKRYVVNLTQACDVQNMPLRLVDDVNYLFLRGEREPVSKGIDGEKWIDTPYYCEDVTSDLFSSFHWNLRQMVTPSMGDLLDGLESYEVVGQLRNDATYSVLAKYMSQASRVARIRLPKVHRYGAVMYQKGNDALWLSCVLNRDVEASVWERKSDDWRVQFSVAEAVLLAASAAGFSDQQREKLVTCLAGSTKVASGSKVPLHMAHMSVANTLLVRLDAGFKFEDARLAEQLGSNEKCKQLSNGAIVVAVYTLD